MAIYIIHLLICAIVLQNESLAVMITSPNNQSVSKFDATCEIHTVASLLENKLMHYICHHGANLSVRVSQLVVKVLYYLSAITTIQLEIYVRK